MSPTITLEILPPHRSAGRACSFHPQGVTAVVHGFSSCTGLQFGSRVMKHLHLLTAEELRAQRNTPDFMLEHFIMFCFDTLADSSTGR